MQYDYIDASYSKRDEDEQEKKKKIKMIKEV